AYQWQRCDAAGANCNNVLNANSQSYALTGSDVNKTIRVVVTATNGLGNGTATSDAFGPINGVPVNNTAPTITGYTGSPLLGDVLTANPGGWSGNPTFAYQWQ